MATLRKKAELQGKQRLDAYLAEVYPQFSRSFLKKLIEQESILLNGRVVKAGNKVKAGDTIELDVP